MRSTALIIVLAVLAVLFIGGCSSYNGFVSKDEMVNQSWSNVQSSYQRRSDLIGNLVETVKGAANFEQSTLVEIANARAKATQITIDPSNATPEQLAQFQQAQGSLSQSLGRLLAVAENYPELKANQNFLELQSQLESTENRVKVERDRFNEAVTQHNMAVRRFPASFFAGIFGFERRAQFEAEAGSEQAPKVQFN